MKTLWLLLLILLIPLNVVRAQHYPPPQNLLGVWVCDSTHVSWDPPDSGDVTGYNIYRLEEEGGEWLFQMWVSGDTDSFVVQGDPPFCHGVTALYDGGESDRAEICDFVIIDVFTFPPDRVDAEATGDTICLSWTSGQFGCGTPVGYEVYRVPEGGIYSQIASVPPTQREYLDPDLDEGTWCYYVDIVSTGGRASSAEACATVSSSAIAGDSPDRAIPLGNDLRQNYPNPFNPATTIRYEIGGTGSEPVDLTIFDVRGRRVRTLVQGERLPGRYEIGWDGKDDRGSVLPSGTYIYRLKVGDQASTRRMTITK